MKQSVFEDNNKDADVLREQLKKDKTFLSNVMSSPGSGKTSTLLALAKAFEGKFKWAVMEADIDSTVDAETMKNAGVDSIQLHTGAVKNMTILSVPEGHDKPLKYPLMYETCDLLVVNKVDVMEYFDFDPEKVVEYAKMRNPNIDGIFISATKGKGVGTLAEWILEKTREWNE